MKRINFSHSNMSYTITIFRQRELKRIGIHLLFWMVSFSFFWLLFSRNSGDQINTAIFLAFLSPISIATTYFFNYRLIPRFLFKGHYFKFIWYSSIIAGVAIWLTLLFGILIWAWRADFNMGEINHNTIDLPMLFAALFFVVLMGVSVKLIRFNQQVQNQKTLAEKQKVDLDNQLKVNELKLLKDQLNPHFLFNTLNNLYGLTLEKSERAPELVMQLSNILDYMLYRTNNTTVPLQQEIEMLHNYVAIEQARFEGRYPISFEVKGQYENLQIAPLLLLPLVENCFKHGIRKSIKASFVDIDIEIEKNSIIFKSSNSIGSQQSTGGIGLPNMQKRLERIYHRNYDLKINNNGTVFETYLSIQLN
ncbi:MAG: histidine kinase [Prolixibacteraceae bacterium]|jgi:LytS/YehU family sensor histidine kinase|nr:histidine kinase [Prolixibacteraceae bacterium]